MNTALLLIAHGSREPGANDDLHHVAREMRRRGGFDVVVASFLELAEPSIPDGAERCLLTGVGRVVMLPYFLSAGVHVRRDLVNHREELANRFPEIEFLLAEPLGQHPRMLDVVAARAGEVLGKPRARAKRERVTP